MEQTGREHPAWLADLRGRRVVVADEMPRGKRWNTARVKKLVSGEPIRARLMHRDFFEFKPTAQVIVAGNHAPQQSSADTGLESRLRVVRAERQPEVEDVRLLDKLKPEHVLSWLLEGAAQYHVEGLRPTPASVAASTRALCGAIRHTPRVPRHPHRVAAGARGDVPEVPGLDRDRRRQAAGQATIQQHAARGLPFRGVHTARRHFVVAASSVTRLPVGGFGGFGGNLPLHVCVYARARM